MTDFKTGDRVLLIENPKYTMDIWKGREGTIRELYSYHQEFAGRIGFDNGDTIMFNFSDIELVKPSFNPGDRVRGYVEGVVAISGGGVDHVIIDDGIALKLSRLSDVTVIKSLPTAPSSIIEFNGVLFTLTAFKTSTGKSIWWPVTGRDSGSAAIEYYGAEFGNDWTLKYDAGA